MKHLMISNNKVKLILIMLLALLMDKQVLAKPASLIKNSVSASSTFQQDTSINKVLISKYLTLHKNNHYAALAAAFKDFFSSNGSATLDLEGLTLNLNRPMDVAAAAGRKKSSAFQRITNGIITASADMPNKVVTKQGQFKAQAKTITLADTKDIVRGMHIAGPGLARETYVTAVNSATEITINTYAISAQRNQQYTFTKFSYILDFSGFDQLSRLNIDHVNFLLKGMASGIMLGTDGIGNHIENNWFVDPKNRGITDFNTGARGISINSNEMTTTAEAYQNPERYPVAITISHNDSKIRSNRIAQFRHSIVIHGGGALIIGNHWWQGAADTIPRTAGLIFTGRRVKGLVDGNYIDNCWIELSNESAAANTTPIGRISIVGNHFTNAWRHADVAKFSWIRIAPYTVNAPVAGILVSGNTFISLKTFALRAESVDNTNGSIDLTKLEDVYFTNNTWEKVLNKTFNPITAIKEVPKGSETATFNFQTENQVPFGAQINSVTGVGLNNMLLPNGKEAFLPYNSYPGSMLPDKRTMQVRFPTPCSGTVTATGTVNVLR